VADELDTLFAAPPTRFIEERKRIVAALKGTGRKDEAKAVEKIPRPSVAVWTVNQIAQRDPELVRRLGATTERLKVAAVQKPQPEMHVRADSAARYAAIFRERHGTAFDPQSLIDRRKMEQLVLLAGVRHAGLF